MWVRTNPSGVTGMFISKQTGFVGEYEFWKSASNQLSWRPSNFQNIENVFTGWNDRWQHLCFTVDGNTIGDSNFAVYRNGIFVARRTIGDTARTVNAALPTTLGARPDGSVLSTLSYADVRIYSRVLEQKEMQFQATKPGAGLARWERKRSRSRYASAGPPSGSLLQSSYFMSFPG